MLTIFFPLQIDDLNLLFIHMHHLINEFRPHQARETLRVMLHVQRRKRLQVANSFQQHLDKVRTTLLKITHKLRTNRALDITLSFFFLGPGDH